MARTQVPEEGQRVQNLTELKNNITPREQAVIRTEGSTSRNDGLSNLYWWDSKGLGNSESVDGTVIVSSDISGYTDPNNDGVWRRMFKPYAEVENDLADGNAGAVQYKGSNGEFVGNTSYLYVDDSNGRVGIGTESPNNKLDVRGNIYIDTNDIVGTDGSISLNSTTRLNKFGGGAFEFDGNGDPVIKDASNDSRITVNDSGRVNLRGGDVAIEDQLSVGANQSPSEALDVEGSGSISSDLSVGNNLSVQDFTFSQDSGELVLSDNNGVELIRQPKAGATKFVQGAEIGSIDAPKDSFTQVLNAASTSSAASGDLVGYSFSIDNQPLIELKADSDGSGGITNKRVSFASDVDIVGVVAGDGLVENTDDRFDVRLPVENGGSPITSAYKFNFGNDLTVSDDGNNDVTISHVDVNSDQDRSNSLPKVVHSIDTDGNGHITTVGTSSFTGGTDITVSGDTIKHDNTGDADSSNSLPTVIRKIITDDRGHVETLNTGTFNGGDGISINGNTINARIDIDDGGSDVAEVYNINFGNQLSASDDNDNQVTVKHANTGSGENKGNSGTTVIQNVETDENGHVDSVGATTLDVVDDISGGTDITVSTSTGSVTVNHADTGDADSSNSLPTVIRTVESDDRGHITNLETGTFTGGTDIDVSGNTISHENTGSDESTGNSGETVIQNVGTDGRGHVTSVSAVGLDSRYVEESGDTMSGALTINDDLTLTDFTFSQESGDLVLSDDSGVDLIRQPKGGATEFVQGAEIGAIEAPEDSLTQIINASSTAASGSGDVVGYTFSVDSQSIVRVKADSDGSGGITNKRTEFVGDVNIGGEIGGLGSAAGDGLGYDSNNDVFNARIPVTDGGSPKADVYTFNFGNQLSVTDDGNNDVTVYHANVNSDQDDSNSLPKVIHSIKTDGNGHVTTVETNSFTGGDDITVTGDTIKHDDTGDASSSNSLPTVIKSVTTGDRGHVESLETGTFNGGDGISVSGNTIDARLPVQDSGSTPIKAYKLNFANALNVNDDNNNEVTIDVDPSNLAGAGGNAGAVQYASSSGQFLGNTSYLYVDDSNGRVGIGTSSPGNLLDLSGGSVHVDSDEGYTGGFSDAGLYPDRDNLSIGGGNNILLQGVNNAYYTANSNNNGNGSNHHAFGFKSSDPGDGTWTETMRIEQSGEVGIGKTSPSEALDVSGNVAISTFLKIGGDTISDFTGNNLSVSSNTLNAVDTTYSAGDGLSLNGTTFNARLPVTDGGSPKADVYKLNFGNDLTVNDDGNNDVTISHVNVSSDNADSDLPTVINTVQTDGNGHVKSVGTETLSGSTNISISGSDISVSPQGSGSGLNADQVDGYDYDDLARPKNVAVLTSSDTSTDLNQGSWVKIPWNVQLQVDAGYTHDPSGNPTDITFDNGGTYRIKARLTFDASGSRPSPGIKIFLNGNQQGGTGLSGYVRNREGHDEASTYVEEVITVNSGDTISVRSKQFADGGNVTNRSNESALVIEQVSKTVAIADDADTVDGKHAADFILSGGDTMTGILDLGGNDLEDGSATIWDASNGYIPQGRLENDTVTIEGNSVSLGGSTSVDHNDLSNISSDDHHTRYSNEEAQDAVGTIMTGSGSVSVNYDDSANTITISGTNTTYSAGDGLSLDGTTFNARLPVTDGGSPKADVYKLNFGSQLSVNDDGNNDVTVYHKNIQSDQDPGNSLPKVIHSVDTDKNGHVTSVGAGTFTGGTDITVDGDEIRHDDTGAATSSNSLPTVIRGVTTDDRGHVESLDTGTFNGGDGISVNGNTVDARLPVKDSGSTPIETYLFNFGNQLSVNDDNNNEITVYHANVNSDENTGNSGGSVIQNVGTDGNGHVTSVSVTDLDPRYVKESGDTMSGALTVNDDLTLSDFTFSQDSGDLVLSDNNGIELIRQPKAGATRFVQGAEIGSIDAPKDSFTQIVNAASTSSASSSDLVGYSFSIDNQPFIELKADADGSGGITNKRVNFGPDVDIIGIEPGDGLVENTDNRFDVRLPIRNNGGSPITSAYSFNFGDDLSVNDDGNNQVTISHVNVNSDQAKSNSLPKVVHSIDTDGNGHIKEIKTNSFTGGDDITVNGDTIKHDDTGDASSSNSLPTVIRKVTTDDRGHVETLDTGTFNGGDGISISGNTIDARIPVKDSGSSPPLKAYLFNFGNDLDVNDDNNNEITVSHVDVSSDQADQSLPTVINTVKTDGNGHVKSVGTETLNGSTNISVSGNDISVSPQGSGSGLNADQVDGYHYDDLARPKNVGVFTSSNTSLNINQNSWVKIPWNVQLQVDAGYTHDPSGAPTDITFDNGGTYRVKAMITYNSGSSRTSPGIKFAINGSRRNALGISGYARRAEGHNEASTYVEETITVNSGDTLTVQSQQFASGGNSTLRANESNLIIEQVSKTVAIADDADTVDGKHAADFVLSGGDTMTGTLDLGGNDLEDGSLTIWDASNSYIPASRISSIVTDLSAGSNQIDVSSSTGSVTIDHGNTGSDQNINNSDPKVIQEVDTDGNGHVTDLKTTNFNISGDGLSTNNGNELDVRIPIEDTGSPKTDAYKLNFSNALTVTDDSNNEVTIDVDPSSLAAADGNAGAVQYASSSGEFVGNTNYLYVDNSNGRVGVGTNSPDQKLDVNGDVLLESNNAPNLRISDEDNSTYAEITSDYQGTVILSSDALNNRNDSGVIFKTNGSEKARVSANGNVGVGTNSPNNNLDVIGQTRSSDIFISGDRGAGASPNWIGYDNTKGFFAGSGSDNAFFGLRNRNGSGGSANTFNTVIYWGDDDVDDLVFRTQDNGELGRFTGDGKFGIGTSSPSEALDVSGNVAISNSIKIGGKTISNFAGSNLSVSSNTLNAVDTTYSAGDGLSLDGTTFNARIPVKDSGSTPPLKAYLFNFGSQLSVKDDNNNEITVEHKNIGSASNIDANNNQVVYDIDVDKNGHVTQMNSQSRRVSDWDAANGPVNMNGNPINNISTANVGSGSATFDFTVDSGDLLISDSNGVDLIRQPEGGATQFIQGAEIGAIEAPEDSYTQILNAASTSSASSGELVGYTLSVDSQAIIEVKADADGSGGISNKRVNFPSDVEFAGAGDGLVSNNGDLDVRLPVQDTASPKTDAYIFNFANQLNVTDDGNKATISVNDGSGSGLDADTLDGYEASEFAVRAENETISGRWTFNNDIIIGNEGDFVGYSNSASYIPQIDTSNAVNEGVLRGTSNIQVIANANNGGGGNIIFAAGGGLPGNSGYNRTGSVDSSGNITAQNNLVANNDVSVTNNINIGGDQIGDFSGDGLSVNSNTLDARITVEDTGSKEGEVYFFNFSGGLNASSSNNQATISHKDTSSEGDVEASSNEIIYDIDIDGYGHVTTLKKESRDINDWNGTLNTPYIDFDNKEQNNYDVDGRLYWDKSAGLYIKSSNIGNGPRLIWDGANVSTGGNLDVSYGGEDEPTISHDVNGENRNVETNNQTVIDDINVDGDGHVTNVNTEDRSLDDWNAANNDLNLSSNNLDNVGTLNVSKITSNNGDNHIDVSQPVHFNGSGSTNETYEVRVSGNGLYVDDKITLGTNSSGFNFTRDSGDLVLSDSNGVELIRQPKAGATKFVQGAEIGSIDAPKDSLTQIINAPSTSSASSGDKVGYTFAIDNQEQIKLEADADGSGGISNQTTTFTGNVNISGNITSITGGDGISFDGSRIDARLPVKDSGSTPIETYLFNFGSQLSVKDDNNNEITVKHKDLSSASNADANGNEVIYDIDVDKNGHVTTLSKESRSLDQWNNPNAEIDFDGNNLVDVGKLGIGTENPDEQLEVRNNGGDSIVKISTDNFSSVEGIEFEHQDSSDSSYIIFDRTGGDFDFNGATTNIGMNYISGREGSNLGQHTFMDDQGNIQMFISDKERVGIGTTSPSSKLDVNGDINFTGNLKGLNGGDGISYDQSTSSIDARIVIRDDGSKKGEAYFLEFLGGLNASSSSNQATISHKDTSSENNIEASSNEVIYDIDIDGYGHVTEMNSEDRRVSDWDAANSAVNMNGNAINNISTVNVGSGSSTFDFTVDSGDLVLSDSNGTDLIRQPEGGATQFVQGAEIGAIESPEDSYTQIINAASTSAASSGDLVGYTFAVDSQSVFEVKADADGSGGISNKRINFSSDVDFGGAGDGLVSNGGQIDVRLPIQDSSSNIGADAYKFNFATNLNARGDSNTNLATVEIQPSGDAGAVQYAASGNELLADKSYLYVDNSNGNVGIGTSSPSNKLQVSGGNIAVDSEEWIGNKANDSYVPEADSNFSTSGVNNAILRTTNILYFAANSNNNPSSGVGTIVFGGGTNDPGDSNWNETMRMQNDRLGIGTTNPSYTLDVDGTFRHEGDDGDFVRRRTNDNSYYATEWQDSSGSRMYHSGVNGNDSWYVYSHLDSNMRLEIQDGSTTRLENSGVDITDGRLDMKNNNIKNVSNLNVSSIDDNSGDGEINVNDTLRFQPSSAGGSVTGILFNSNTNAGSDLAKIIFDDDYHNVGEGAALRFRVENDARSNSGSGPDSIVFDAVGGVDMARGDLVMNGSNIDSVSNLNVSSIDKNGSGDIQLNDTIEFNNEIQSTNSNPHYLRIHSGNQDSYFNDSQNHIYITNSSHPQTNDWGSMVLQSTNSKGWIMLATSDGSSPETKVRLTDGGNADFDLRNGTDLDLNGNALKDAGSIDLDGALDMNNNDINNVSNLNVSSIDKNGSGAIQVNSNVTFNTSQLGFNNDPDVLVYDDGNDKGGPYWNNKDRLQIRGDGSVNNIELEVGNLHVTNGGADIDGNLDMSSGNIDSVNSIDIARDGINAIDSWLEINGGSNGILANYDDNNEFRHYGNVTMYSGSTLDMSDNNIKNVGNLNVSSMNKNGGGDIQVNDNLDVNGRLQVGSNNHIEIKQADNSNYPFADDANNPVVFRNIEGGSNQHLFLGDTRPSNNDTIFGVGHSDGTSIFDLRGNGDIYTNGKISLEGGEFEFETDNGDLVLSDSNGVELIRQPKAGATEFIQGAEIGAIEAPEDSLTQIVNAASTSAASSGDTVGYTFAIDNQEHIKLEADADGSGGISNQTTTITGDLDVSGQVSGTPAGNKGAVQYNSGNDTLAGNTSYLYIDDNNGEVGVGTDSPSYQLDVDGKINAQNNIRLNGNQLVGDNATFDMYSNHTVWSPDDTSVDFRFTNPDGGSDLLRVTDGGVGVFEDSPDSALDVSGGDITMQPSSSGGTTEIRFKSNVNENSDFGLLKWYDNNDTYADGSTGSEVGVLALEAENDAPGSGNGDHVALIPEGNAILDPGGNVGINETSPSYALDINGNLQVQGTGSNDIAKIAMNNDEVIMYDDNNNASGPYWSNIDKFQIRGDSGDITKAELEVGNLHVTDGGADIDGNLRVQDSLDVDGLLANRVILKETWGSNNTTSGDLGNWSFSSGFGGSNAPDLPDGKYYNAWDGGGTVTLTSPSLDLRDWALASHGGLSDNDSHTETRLMVTAWIWTDSADFEGEYHEIQMSGDDGSNWNTVYRDEVNEDSGSPRGWTQARADISKYINPDSDAKIRFRTTGGGGADYYGVGTIYIHESFIPTDIGGLNFEHDRLNYVQESGKSLVEIVDGDDQPLKVESGSSGERLIMGGNEIEVNSAALYLQNDSGNDTYINASGGQTGIGTSSTSHQLDVDGDGSFTNTLYMNSNNIDSVSNLNVSSIDSNNGNGAVNVNQSFDFDNTDNTGESFIVRARTDGEDRMAGVFAKQINEGTHTPSLLAAGEGDSNDILFEARGNTNGTGVDLSNTNSSNDWVYRVQGKGDTYIGRGDDNTGETRRLEIRSNGRAAVNLYSDDSDDGNEAGGAYTYFSQDGGSVNWMAGTIQSSGNDPLGVSFSGTSGNSFLLGSQQSDRPIHIGDNGTVVATISDNNSYEFDLSGSISLTDQILMEGSNYDANNSSSVTKGSIGVGNPGAADGGHIAFFDNKAPWNDNGILLSTGEGLTGTPGDIVFATEGGGNDIIQHGIIDGSNGRFGIGTTSPSAKLEVDATNSDPLARIYSNESAGYEGLVVDTDGENNNDSFKVRTNSFPPNNSYSNSDTKFIVKGDGDVGIGTYSPSYDLDVPNGTVRAEKLQLKDKENASNGQIVRDDSTGFLAQWDGQGQAVLWDSYNVSTGNNVDVSGGKGGQSTPDISLVNSPRFPGGSIGLNDDDEVIIHNDSSSEYGPFWRGNDKIRLQSDDSPGRTELETANIHATNGADIEGSLKVDNEIFVPTPDTRSKSRSGALQKRVSMNGGNAEWAAIESGTRIWKEDVNGNVVEEVVTTSEFEKGSFGTSPGDLVWANKPIGLEQSGYEMPPLSFADTEFVFNSTRNTPLDLEIYAPEETAEVTVDADGGNTTYTTTVQSGQHDGSININENGIHFISSTAPIVVASDPGGGDRLNINPPAKEIMVRSAESIAGVETGTSAGYTRNGDYIRFDNERGTSTPIADGSGGDAEQHIPVASLGKRYAVYTDLGDWAVSSVYPTTVEVYQGDGTLYTTHDLSGATRRSPETETVGSQSGDSQIANGPWFFKADAPFMLRYNDASNDEKTAINGWWPEDREGDNNKTVRGSEVRQGALAVQRGAFGDNAEEGLDAWGDENDIVIRDNNPRIVGDNTNTSSGSLDYGFEIRGNYDFNNSFRLRGGSFGGTILGVDNDNTHLDVGNVGINTTSPSEQLDVNGAATFNQSYGEILLGDPLSGNTDPAVNIRRDDWNGGDYFQARAAGGSGDEWLDIGWYDGSLTDIMELRASGNVGIGVNNPSYALDVDGIVNVQNRVRSREYRFTDESNSGGQFRIVDVNDDSRLQIDHTNDFGTDFLSMDHSSNEMYTDVNFGVGTTDPDSALDVSGGDITMQPSSSGGTTEIRFKSNTNAGSDFGLLKWYDNNDTYADGPTGSEVGVLALEAENDGPGGGIGDHIALIPEGNVILDPADGNVGVNTTSPNATLDVSGNLRTGDSIYINRGNGNKMGNALLSFGRRTGDGATEENWKIATLPDSSSSTGDLIVVEFFGGRYGAGAKFQQTIRFGNRGGFEAHTDYHFGNWQGSGDSPQIRAFENGDGTVDIYLRLPSNDWKGGSVNIREGSGINSDPPTIYSEPSNVGTSPGGTEVFNSLNDAPQLLVEDDKSVGIGGETSPSSTLDVNGSASFNSISVNGNIEMGGNNWIGLSSGPQIEFESGGVELQNEPAMIFGDGPPGSGLDMNGYQIDNVGTLDVNGGAYIDGTNSPQDYDNGENDPVIDVDGNGLITQFNGSQAPFRQFIQNGTGRVHMTWNAYESGGDYYADVGPGEGSSYINMEGGSIGIYADNVGAGNELDWQGITIDDTGRLTAKDGFPSIDTDGIENTTGNFNVGTDSEDTYVSGDIVDISSPNKVVLENSFEAIRIEEIDFAPAIVFEDAGDPNPNSSDVTGPMNTGELAIMAEDEGNSDRDLLVIEYNEDGSTRSESLA